MLELTRRGLFAGATATAAATMLPRVSEAAAPTIKGGGFFTYKVGDFDIIALRDGARTFPMPDGFVANVSKDKAIEAAAQAYIPNGNITVPFNPMLINTGSKLVLIDTGNGAAALEASKGAVGNLIGSMASAGVEPKDVDIVIISHFHGDHINGLKNADGTPAFPNAEIKVPAAEAAFWADEGNASKANGYNKAQFAGNKKAMEGLKTTPYEADKEVAPGITSVSTPGHTPGHMSFVVSSGSGKLFVQSDVTNIPAFFLRNPDWFVAFDNDPETAKATRHRIYDMAAAEKMLIAGYHFPFPCMGHVEKDGTGYRLVSAV